MFNKARQTFLETAENIEYKGENETVRENSF
jgi:hypothetical protein